MMDSEKWRHLLELARKFLELEAELEKRRKIATDAEHMVRATCRELKGVDKEAQELVIELFPDLMSREAIMLGKTGLMHDGRHFGLIKHVIEEDE